MLGLPGQALPEPSPRQREGRSKASGAGSLTGQEICHALPVLHADPQALCWGSPVVWVLVRARDPQATGGPPHPDTDAQGPGLDMSVLRTARIGSLIYRWSSRNCC